MSALLHSMDFHMLSFFNRLQGVSDVPSLAAALPLFRLFFESWPSKACCRVANTSITFTRLATSSMTASSPSQMAARTYSSVGKCSCSIAFIFSGFEFSAQTIPFTFVYIINFFIPVNHQCIPITFDIT